MDGNELIKRLAVYGADIGGINDRFRGDAELYAKCFEEFLNEPNFDLLQSALKDGKYGEAFGAAHAIKGLAGNLGLTPFYVAVSALVESLLEKRYAQLKEKLENVIEARDRLRVLAYAPVPAANETRPEERKRRALILIVGFVLIALVLAVTLLLTKLIRDYGNRIDVESSSHLAEINYQIKLYIEEKIESDWKITHSVANSVMQREGESLYADIREYMERERDVWGVTEIILYTEDGYGLRSDGAILASDVASDMAFYAQRQSEYLSIVRSELNYTVPVETNMTLRGSKIVAVSVIQDLGSFLDGMDFSSFGGAAYMYLTQKNGAIISRLTHPQSRSAYNILSLMEGRRMICLSGEAHSAQNMLTSEEPITHILLDPEGDRYVVSTPIATHHEDMRLFYVAPEAVVNRTLNDFSRYITALCVAVVAAFAVFAVVVFLFVYRGSKRRFDQAFIERERMYDLLVRNSGTAFALFSTQRDRPLYISSNAQRIVGEAYMSLKKTETGYRMTSDTGVPNDAIAQINREMADWDGKSVFRSGHILHPGGDAQPRFYAFQLYPVEEGGSEYVGIAQDTTIIHDREQVVADALSMAQASNAAKSRFLSNMSHDIRTPMNAIINMTRFSLENLGDAKKMRGYLTTILDSSEHLLRLINDVLDMNRIESGQVAIARTPFDIKAEMETLCDIVRPLCEAREQTFIVNTGGLRVRSVLGDRLKLSQILVNLLGNAVKFTPNKGAIRFTVSEIPSTRPDHASIRFVVEDNGIGISKEDLPRIFEPFMRVDDKRVSGVEGTGLGLPICKSYVTAIGGIITCQSEEDNGTKFTVELSFPLAEGEAPALPKSIPTVDKPFEGKRCLICEDNSVNQLIAVKILEELGFMTEVAADGMAGSSRFIASAPGHFDVIYMDIRMPVMDGYEATVAIRQSGHPQARTIPIIAMTANVLAEDVEKSRIAGMNGHLGKPVTILGLVAETMRVLEDAAL